MYVETYLLRAGTVDFLNVRLVLLLVCSDCGALCPVVGKAQSKKVCAFCVDTAH
jgi:hypothetical protein